MVDEQASSPGMNIGAQLVSRLHPLSTFGNLQTDLPQHTSFAFMNVSLYTCCCFWVWWQGLYEFLSGPLHPCERCDAAWDQASSYSKQRLDTIQVPSPLLRRASPRAPCGPRVSRLLCRVQSESNELHPFRNTGICRWVDWQELELMACCIYVDNNFIFC